MLKSMVSGQRVTGPSAAYETYRDLLQDSPSPKAPLAASASFVDGKALNG